MRLVISVDVEEEGLFSGRYPRQPAGVENVTRLRSLAFVRREFGLPLTLMVSHAAAVDPACRDELLYFKDELGAEIGAHLHHWNTPPFDERANPGPPDSLGPDLLRAKLMALVAAIGENLGVRPCSFRMGRFELGDIAPKILPELGIHVDSSLAPLRLVQGGVDHFSIPADPFWLGQGGPRTRLLEVPLTTVPVFASAPALARSLARLLPESWGAGLLSGFRRVLGLGVHPAWFGPRAMRLAALAHLSRGGRVINVFLHSSELLPGGSPKFPDQASVDALIARLRGFLAWLVRAMPVHGLTLSELHAQWTEQGGPGSD
ncbi:MAG: hypothetical protein PHV85_08785 [Desulfovibrionaceae bacterium]|nr:hypothetical protein [Desulfovibrionaceae bacterium]